MVEWEDVREQKEKREKGSERTRKRKEWKG